MRSVADLLSTRTRRRLFVLYERHRRIFWILHSLWALATGVLVLALAHNRWGLTQWVIVFLGVTWASTLFFTRLSARLPDSATARLGREFVSYLTRVMYQETLFFLLPFYWSSATVGSWNLVFVGLLAALAVLACLDLVFDDLLRRHDGFGLFFFAFVTFASLNFLLPVLFRVRLELATPAAAAGGLAAALPLVWKRGWWRRPAALAQLAVAIGLAGLLVGPARSWLPPVPLRLASLAWAPAVDEATIRPVDPVAGEVPTTRLPEGRLAVVAEIFAPRRLVVSALVVWSRDGVELVRSRRLEISPHRWGFRIWHGFRAAGSSLPPGRYEVSIETVDGRLLGRREIAVRP